MKTDTHESYDVAPPAWELLMGDDTLAPRENEVLLSPAGDLNYTQLYDSEFCSENSCFSERQRFTEDLNKILEMLNNVRVQSTNASHPTNGVDYKSGLTILEATSLPDIYPEKSRIMQALGRDAVPSITEVKTALTKSYHQNSNFSNGNATSPFGGDLDEMTDYKLFRLTGFGLSAGDVPLNDAFVYMQHHLLCFGKAFTGDGCCRVLQGTSDPGTPLVRGPVSCLDTVGIKTLIVSPLFTGLNQFLVCHDGQGKAFCRALQVSFADESSTTSGDESGSGFKGWPRIIFSDTTFAWANDVDRLISATTTKPQIRTKLRTSPAEFSLCYFINEMEDKAAKKKLYRCDRGLFDDDDLNSLRKDGQLGREALSD